MFHVLTPNSAPNYLVSDWKDAPSTVVCGAPTGQRRSAISTENFNKYSNSGTLSNRLCKACAKKLGIRVPERN